MSEWYEKLYNGSDMFRFIDVVGWVGEGTSVSTSLGIPSCSPVSIEPSYTRLVGLNEPSCAGPIYDGNKVDCIRAIR